METLINNQIRDNYKIFLSSFADSKADVSETNVLAVQQQYFDLLDKNVPINIDGVEVDFNADRWDLSVLTRKGGQKGRYIYIFTRDGERLTTNNEIVMKLFLLYALKNSGVHSAIMTVFNKQISFLLYLQSFGVELTDISVADVEGFLGECRANLGTQKKIKSYIYQLLVFCSQIIGIKNDPEVIEFLKTNDVAAINAEINQNKTPLLPSDFYNEFTNLLLKQRDEFSERDNIICRLVFLQTQSGLRSGEIVLLSPGNVKKLEVAGKTAYYLEYKGTKGASHKKESFTISKIAVSKQFYTIFCELEDIVSKYPKAQELDTIAYDPKKEMILRQGLFNQFISLFCLKNAKKLKLINREDADKFASSITIKDSKYANHSFAKEFNLKAGSVISYPNTKQFRVYCATELYNRGVSDELVAQMYGHKTLTMYHYYCRDTHPVQEDINYSQELVKEIVRDDLSILGPKGDSFKEKINSIITDNKLNVAKDLDEIIDKVCDEMPIRAKTGGFCVKSNPRRECFHDAKTDEFMCAYGCCPNHCHLFFMAPISYDKCKDHKNLVRYNLDNGFTKAAQKEAILLKHSLHNELEPELTDLYKEMDKQGEVLFTKHTDLASFVQKIDIVKNEVNEWKKMISQILD